MATLVSLITPCLNGEKFVHRLLDSVLEQSYDEIEHIFIDDGSTDRTAQIVKAYIPKYEERGKRLVYYYQKNSKAAAALNNGLKLITGDFISWPDSDDYYSSKDSIEIMVKTIQGLSEDYGMVRCDAILVEEDTLSPIAKFSDNKPNAAKEDLFEDCILEKSFWYTPGCYLTTRTVIDDVILNREIFVNNDVQNWQMYLPILYKYKCYYIDQPLHCYLVRRSSYCHQVIPFDVALKRTYIHEEIIRATLSRIKMDSKSEEEYVLQITRKYLLKRLGISFQHSEKESFRKYYFMLKRNFSSDVSLMLEIKGLVLKLPFILNLIRKIKKEYAIFKNQISDKFLKSISD